MRITRRTLLAGAAASPLAQSAQNAGGPLNLIHIGVDTWGAHHTGFYGHADYLTPHIDRLMAKSGVFTQAYPQALPTIPARRALYTGRRIFPSQKIFQPDDPVRIRGWHQMFAEDVTLSEVLQQNGYATAIVSDLYHQFKPGKNFTRGFDSWQWIRGQESDRYRTGGRSRIDLTKGMHASQPSQKAKKAAGVFQYLLNRQDWKQEEDWLAAQVFDTAGRWLEENTAENQPFYLHIESFAPHEFWDPPEDYYRLYMKKDYKGPRLIHPPSTTQRMSPLEVEHAVALYKGLVTFTDARIGRFLDQVERLGLMNNSIIVFVGDHGTMMGEQGQLHKGEIRLRAQCTQVPLSIYHPRVKLDGRKIDGYIQHTDLMPTVLDLLAQKTPSRVTGESFATRLTGGLGPKRDWIITGWGEHASVRTPEYNCIARWSPGPPFQELYDLKADPLELTNIASARPKVVEELRGTLIKHVEESWEITRGRFAIHAD